MRSFAIIPAAGTSQRMGSPKLLLPWKGKPIIEHVLAAWSASPVSHIVAIVRRGDQQLQTLGRQFDVELVCPTNDPPQMKHSVEIGLRHVAAEHDPADSDVWLLAPADMPRLTTTAINEIVAAHDPQQPAIIVPVVDGRSGHPVLFPWSVGQGIFQLSDDQGVNHLVKAGPTRRIQLTQVGCLQDVDTPEDYQRMLSDD